jgi:HEAT repeat protein
MSHRRIVWAVMLLGLVPAGYAPGRADDDPTFLDKKLSYWLQQLTAGKDARARRRGVLAVEQVGHAGSRKVIPALVKALEEDKDPSVRAAAAHATGRAVARAMEQARTDKKDPLPRFDAARDALAKALRTDRSDAVREAAAGALGDIGPDARAAAGVLGAALKAKPPALVKAAASALRRMGKDARDAQAELLGLLGDRTADAEARTDAALALGQFGPDAAAALPVLKGVLADAKAALPTRRAAAETLGKMGREAGDAAGALAAVLTAKDAGAELRLAAVTALDQVGPGAKAAVPALVKATADGDRVVRCLAMQLLGRLGKDLDAHQHAAVVALLKCADDPNVEVCVAAIESLAALSAAQGLTSGDADAAVKKLDAILAREGRKPIRQAAQAAREKIRPPKKK